MLDTILLLITITPVLYHLFQFIFDYSFIFSFSGFDRKVNLEDDSKQVQTGINVHEKSIEKWSGVVNTF